MIHDKPAACYNCCDLGGGMYSPYEGETQWHMGLDEHGQAHYSCADCAPGLFNVRPIHTNDKTKD
jgi:hypothetical protein